MNDDVNDTKRRLDDGDDMCTWAGAYALGALSEEDARAYEDYLVGADAARTEATELADTAVMLGLAARPESPSPELKNSIMAMLDSTPQLPALDQAAETTTAETTADARITPIRAVPAASADDAPRAETATTSTDAATPAQSKARQRWFTRPVTALAAVAAATALIVGGAFGVTSYQSIQQQQAVAQQVEQIVAAPDSQKVSTEIDRGGNATLVYSPELGQSAMLLDGLESLSAEQIYELWYIDGTGAATPAGLFSMPDEGTHRVVLDGDFQPGDTIGVTVEQAGGAETPSDDLVVAIPTA